MGSINYLVIAFVALFGHITTTADANPEAPELREQYWDTMKFDWETTSRTEDYSVQGTTYFSQSRRRYRFDTYNGDNQLHLLFLGNNYVKVVYYFHSIDFNGRPKRSCYRMEHYQTFGRNLPYPIPDGSGYHLSGWEMLHGQPHNVYRSNFSLSSPPAYELINFEQSDLLVPTSGKFPVRWEYKRWKTYNPYQKQRLDKHEVTDYYHILNGEYNDIWPKENHELNCLEVTHDDPRGEDIIAYANVVHAPEKLKCVFDSSCSGQYPRYRTGGVRTDFEATGEADEGYSDTTSGYGYHDQEDLPLHWDWRDSGAVTPVKNQRECGSCWAFGAVAALESAYFLKYNRSLVFSEQFLVDCAWYKNSIGSNIGCASGRHGNAFEWIQHHGGIALSEDYGPYKNMNGRCSYGNNRTLYAQIRSIEPIPPTDYDFKRWLVQHGPIVVYIYANPAMFSYSSGIIKDCAYEASKLNHFVLVVGYGETTDHEPYWIIKNSWGHLWGMDGYFLLSAKDGENCLGIMNEPLFPVLE